MERVGSHPTDLTQRRRQSSSSFRDFSWMSRPRDPVQITEVVPIQHRHIEPLAPRRRNRPKVAHGTRQAVYSRDGYRCRCCGSEENLTIDHVRPLSRGGKNVKSNMQTLCFGCNQEKADGRLRVARPRAA